MSVPEKHHYLPRWYIERWSSAGQVFRFLRPRGPGDRLHSKPVAPSAIAYVPNLYALPTEDCPVARQRLELDFYQRMDDRAAVAFDKIDREQQGSHEDRVAFAQFVLSLPLRNPAHIEHTRKELRRRVIDYADDERFNDYLTAEVNKLIAEAIQSPQSIDILARMRVFKIGFQNAAVPLLTSDRPTLLSKDIPSEDGFVVFPYAPSKLIVLANDPEVASAFYTQQTDDLIRAINDAVVSQAEQVVIGRDESCQQFIDERFLKTDRFQRGAVDENGMVRWRSPLTRVPNLVPPLGKRSLRSRLLSGSGPPLP